MNQVPNPAFLFHFTAFRNLESIFRTGCLKSKNCLHKEGIQCANIAYNNIQDKRARTMIPETNGRTLHDYVPFHFAPRSPMLYTIKNGNVAEAEETCQDNLIYFVTSVDNVLGTEYVFTDYHPLPAYASFYSNLSDLGEINWELFFERPTMPDSLPFPGYCKFFNSKNTPEKHLKRQETREAEFLIFPEVSLDKIIMIGVKTKEMKIVVENLLHAFGINTKVEVKEGWYF